MNFGITARLALLLAIVGVAAAGLTGFYAHDASRNLLAKSSMNELLTSTQVLASRIVTEREGVSRNLRLLSAHPAALDVLNRAVDSPNTDAEDSLATLFELILRTNPDYFQIRLISQADHGLERVRVDRSGDTLLRIGGDALQEKGHYAYVFDALKLDVGETYLSRFLINHEQGTHAGQDQPSAILAMPVVDAQGVRHGVIVINVDLQGIFRKLKAGLPKDLDLFLANGRGDFLIHPDPAQTFGFDRGRSILVQDEFPQTAALVTGDAPEAVFEANTGRHATYPVVAAFISQGVTVTTDEQRLILGLTQPLAAVLRQADSLGAEILQIVLGLCVICVLLAIALARAVTRPINSMSMAVQEFSSDKKMRDLPVSRNDEIGTLARSFQRLAGQIRSQMHELEQSRMELRHLAQHDPLTGLPNRALFDDRATLALASVRRDGSRLAMIFIDLDGFKPVNDRFGHAAGDAVLKEIASRIRSSIRESDTAARIGGDEFVVLLRNIQTSADALAVSEKIREALSRPCTLENQRVSVSASIGISIYPEHGTDMIELCRNADHAMYIAKARGGNAIAQPAPAMKA